MVRVAAVLAALGVLAACSSSGSPPPIPTAASTDVLIDPSSAATGDWTLDLPRSATNIRITFVDTGTALFHLPTAAHPPSAVVLGHTLTVTPADDPDLYVDLARSVPWRVQLRGGASSLTIDAGDGTLTGLTLQAGVSTVEVTAGAPSGLVDVRETGGVSNLSMDLPDGTGVQVVATGGVGTVTLYGRSQQGIPGGGTVSTPGFAGRGYRIDAVAGISTIAVA